MRVGVQSRSRALIILLMSPAGTLVPYVAGAETYQLEKSHADLVFSINHAGFTEKHGLFRDLEATLDYDPRSPQNSRVTVIVKMSSLDTVWPARDDDVKGEAFLNVAKYPEMRFVSTRVTKLATDMLSIEGNLTLHGVTKPLALQAKLNKQGPNPFDHRPTLGFTANGSLRRSDFGISNYLPLIGDVVTITIDVEFNRTL